MQEHRISPLRLPLPSLPPSHSERGLRRKTDLLVARLRPGPEVPGSYETKSHNPSGKSSPRLTERKDREDKVELLKTLVREKTLQIDDLKLENELLRNRAEVATQESLKSECGTLKTRLSTLSVHLSEHRSKLLQFQDLTLFSPSPDLLRKAERYSHFLHANISQFPTFESLFLDRAGSPAALAAMITSQNYFNALLICLQILCDLMVLQSEESTLRDFVRTTESSQADISDLPISPIEGPSDVQSFVTRVEDEYEKMVDESRKLSEKIDLQSKRIAALSQQMATRLGSQVSTLRYRSSAVFASHH